MSLLRAVLPLAISLSLLACATPLRAAPALSLNSPRPPQQVADCLQQGLQKLHIPDDFVERREESDGSRSLALRNPVSDASGTRVDILPRGEGRRQPAGSPVERHALESRLEEADPRLHPQMTVDKSEIAWLAVDKLDIPG